MPPHPKTHTHSSLIHQLVLKTLPSKSIHNWITSYHSTAHILVRPHQFRPGPVQLPPLRSPSSSPYPPRPLEGTWEHLHEVTSLLY